MTRTYWVRLGLTVVLAVAVTLVWDPPMPAPATDAMLPDIRVNTNHHPAGRLQGGVLALALEAGTGTWHLDGDDQPGVPMQAFGEVGGPLQIPGPLIRVPAGTEVRVSLRNAIADTTLVVRGLLTRPVPSESNDAVHVPSGEVREVRFRLDVPGTYYYWGTTADKAQPVAATGLLGCAMLCARFGADSQLSGAIIVDPPGSGPVANEEVFVIGEWGGVLKPNGLPLLRAVVTVINGRSWPHTDRLTYAQGASIHWRWINTTFEEHPLHLHGFYFRVGSRGDGFRDTIYQDDGQRDRVVTEHLMPGDTRTLTWVAERPGNWLFHCHHAYHFRQHFALDMLQSGHFPALGTPEYRQALEPTHEMGGMILGVTVRPKGATYRSRADSARRHLFLTAEVALEHTAAVRAYRYVLGDPMGPAPAPGGSNPPIILSRDVPVRITVRNRLPEPTTVHWHGIELESYYDGAAGFSGDSQRTTPMIDPGQSFDALFRPPRAGTFIYHTHMNDVEQLEAGLAGPLIILKPGERFDPTRDHIILITAPRSVPDQGKYFLVNGMNPTEPIDLRLGVRHRLRFINMHSFAANVTVELKNGTGLVRWRALAKDGRDLPVARQTVRSARQVVSMGETADFEFVPEEVGDHRLEFFDQPGGKVFNTLVLRIET